MTVMIGNARISEHGTVNGSAGDQTSKEVMTQSWSTGGLWEYVIRPKSADVARNIADAMIKACKNNKIGYSQGDRTSLYNLAARNGYKLDEVGYCNTDCSALVSVCVNAAGIRVSQNMYTGNELSILKNTGQFVIFTDPEYTKHADKLRTGDILLRSGHTAIVTKGAIDLPTEDKKEPMMKGGATMYCTYTKDGKDTVYFFDPNTGKEKKLKHPDELAIIRKVYKDNNGHDMPHYTNWHTNKNPWWKRLLGAFD